jgi:hypothetical protein
MNDTAAELVERRMPRAGVAGWMGLSMGELVAATLVCVTLVLAALARTDTPTVIACVIGIMLTVGLFLLPLNAAKERAIHLVPRYLRFARSYVGRRVDVHARVVEGRHHTHREIPTDVPLSPHLGAVWLSNFTWGSREVGLIVEGGSRWQPWKAAHSIVVQLSGHDQLLLESADYQDTLLRRWTGFLNTLSKRSLGLTGAQELLLSRPMIQGEGAHWRAFNPRLDGQKPELAERYRNIQLAHDATDTDRRLYLVLRSGGTFTAWFKARHRGSSRAGVEEHFGQILAKIGQMAKTATLTLVGVLSAEQLSAELRLMVDPASAPAVGYRRDGKRAIRSAPYQVAPITEWKVYRDHVEVNGWVAATYRVVAWPDTVHGSSLLDAALMDHQGILRVAVPIAPADPKTTRRLVKAGMTNAEAKAIRKAATGAVTTEDERITDAQSAQRDVEMARGKHQPVFYTGYFTSIAEDEAALRRAVDDLATQLDTSAVDIQACYGFQAEAYAFTLPFCRGAA